MKKISIVIPIYNREQVLDKCLESVMNQQYEYLEIILVNDGSTDKSADICKKWVSNYPLKFFYYEKKNGGVSSARNLGIKKATGEFIQFVDSDDTVDFNYSQKMSAYMPDVDLVISGYQMTKNEKILSTLTLTKKHYMYHEFLKHILDFIYPNNFLYSPWNKLYSLKKIRENNIEFDENYLIGEDALFNLDYISKSERIQIIPDVLYYHEKGSLDAATTTVNCQWFSANYKIANQIKLLLKRNDLSIKNSFSYKYYAEGLTSLYFTRLFAFKRQQTLKVHVTTIYTLLNEYQKWDIFTYHAQKRTTKFLLFLINKHLFFLATVYTLSIRMFFQIKFFLLNHCVKRTHKV